MGNRLKDSNRISKLSKGNLRNRKPAKGLVGGITNWVATLMTNLKEEEKKLKLVSRKRREIHCFFGFKNVVYLVK